MSAMSASAHVSVLRRSPPPRALLASFSSPFARTRTDSNVTIRGASATDLPALANLCTDAFFGTHTFGDGPVIFAQRSAIYAKVFAQLARRIGIEDGREARLLVAVDPSTGALRGCVDLAVHLFDRLEQRFELTIDEMPENGRKRYSWLPYVASLAVSPESRRQGIARQLMREAEHRARFEWGYREMCLEAACCNLDAINFYKRLGYTIVRSDVPGTGATIVETRGFYWEVLPVEKYLMKRRLSGF
eukprot:jgi/Chrpa1/693/Chrysochromulina_OHIO_Genome00009334-RA